MSDGEKETSGTSFAPSRIKFVVPPHKLSIELSQQKRTNATIARKRDDVISQARWRAIIDFSGITSFSLIWFWVNDFLQTSFTRNLICGALWNDFLFKKDKILYRLALNRKIKFIIFGFYRCFFFANVCYVNKFILPMAKQQNMIIGSVLLTSIIALIFQVYISLSCL